jgi:hypothetical protein
MPTTGAAPLAMSGAPKSDTRARAVTSEQLCSSAAIRAPARVRRLREVQAYRPLRRCARPPRLKMRAWGPAQCCQATSWRFLALRRTPGSLLNELVVSQDATGSGAAFVCASVPRSARMDTLKKTPFKHFCHSNLLSRRRTQCFVRSFSPVAPSLASRSQQWSALLVAGSPVLTFTSTATCLPCAALAAQNLAIVSSPCARAPSGRADLLSSRVVFAMAARSSCSLVCASR